MALTLDATVGGSSSNSYVTEAEADDYFDARIPLATPWDDAESKPLLLIMGTRVLDAAFLGQRILVPARNGASAYWKIGRKWRGAPASTTQRLAWPRTGLTHPNNGAGIAEDELPWELKDAVAELAGQLGLVDRTLDNSIITQGITSAKAGSVSVSFRDGAIFPATLPQAVIDLIPPGWYDEEIDEPTQRFDFAAVLE